MMGQFPSTFVGAKGRAWGLKTMMTARPTKIVFSLHLCTVESPDFFPLRLLVFYDYIEAVLKESQTLRKCGSSRLVK